MRTFEVKEGLLFEEGEIVKLPLADQIAQANGDPFIERLVKRFDGKKIVVGDDLKITEIQEDFI